MACNIHIGTSGWHYKHWLGNFYPERLPAGKMLEHYVQHFDSVELNNTFYKLPDPDALAAWRKQTPKDFIFAVKGSRFLTHNLKLSRPENALHNLLPRVQKLGKKLGPILFQLPPKWRVNTGRLEEFLQALPPKHRYTFELREPSWLSAEVYRILERYRASFCIYEIGFFHSPMVVTADLAYVRLHGPGNKYQGSYSYEVLRKWAKQIEEWSRCLKAVYLYFDNDDSGFAAQNALALKQMLLGSKKEAA